MIVDDLAAYLQSQNKGTANTDIFGYHRDDRDEAIILSEYQSNEGFHHKENGHTVDEHCFVQVKVRGKVASDVYSRALGLHAILNARHKVLNGKKYYSMQCLQRPTSLGKDKQDRHQYVFNVEIHRPEGGT